MFLFFFYLLCVCVSLELLALISALVDQEEQDPQYQTRVKSTITVHLTLQKRTSTRKENGAEQVTAGRRQQGRTAAAAQTETASESEPSSDTDG